MAAAWLVVALAGCAGEAEESEEVPAACNGHVHLCERAYDEVAYATTHNAMANETEFWIMPNQNLPIERQLADGVRALMLDSHYDDDGELMLCHGWCGMGSRPLVEALAAIRAFMESNPGEVVTILFEDAISDEDTERAMVESGLIELAFKRAEGEPWPTLGELIERGERVVVFAERSGGREGWHLYMWDFVWDTKWGHDDLDELAADCGPNRGRSTHPLFLMNHWHRSMGHPDTAELVNGLEFLGARVARCHEEAGTMPNFIGVDFHDVGDVLEVVELLNTLGAVELE